MSLGKRIQYYRKQNHLTQEELAEKLSVSRQAVSRWESDTNEPDIKTLITLTEIFHITVDELVKEGLIDDEIKQENTQNNNEDETIIQNQEKILKAHKRNHRLLMFIVIFIVAIFIVPSVCSFISFIESSSHSDSEPKISNLYSQLIDSSTIHNLKLNVEIVDFKEQTMNLKPIVTFKYDIDGPVKMTVIYQDQSIQTIDLTKIDVERIYTGHKKIPARNITEIKINAKEIEETFTDIQFHIAEYMYGFEIDSFSSKIENNHSYICLNTQKSKINHLFESQVSIENPELKDRDYVGHLDTRVEIYDTITDELIFEKDMELKEIQYWMELPEIIKGDVWERFKVIVKTPLGDEAIIEYGD